jgi:hypothetical protein
MFDFLKWKKTKQEKGKPDTFFKDFLLKSRAIKGIFKINIKRMVIVFFVRIKMKFFCFLVNN